MNPISAILQEVEREHARERSACPACGQRLPRPVRPGKRALIIIAAVAFEFDLEPEDILGRDRHKRVARARQVCCYLLRVRLKRSYPEIAEVMGIDHTGAMYAIKSVEKWLQDPESVDRMSAIQLALEDNHV